MAKKVYMVHGWGGNPNKNFFLWLRQELKKKGFEVEAFSMPNTEEPKMVEWIGFLKENVDERTLGEESYFIGHSVGCQAILRYLENLDSGIKIGGCIFIAGWFHLQNLESEEEEKIAKPWLETEIDFDKVKNHCTNFLAVFSNNDPHVPLTDRDIFRELLGAETVVKLERGHFDSPEDIKDISEIFNFLER